MEVVSDRLLRALPDLLVLIVSLLGQIAGVAWLIGWRAARASRRTKMWIAAVGALSMAAGEWVSVRSQVELYGGLVGWQYLPPRLIIRGSTIARR